MTKLQVHDTRSPEGDGQPMRYTEGPRVGEVIEFDTEAQARLWLALYGIDVDHVVIAPEACTCETERCRHDR